MIEINGIAGEVAMERKEQRAYKVYYQKAVEGQRMFEEKDFNPNELSKTHAEMATVMASEGFAGMEDIFRMMNGPENPLATPGGQSWVAATETWHTSMSVNDVLVDQETKKAYVVRGIGFEELGVTEKEPV